MGIMQSRFSQESYHSLVTLTLLVGFAAVLIIGLLLSRLTARDYRTVFTTAVVLISLGLILLCIFFAFMDMVVSTEVYGILLLVFLTLYGLAMIMDGVAHYFLSQKVYRLYFFDFMRSLPHAYRRYRI
jgi:drug/metabolite transporter (DMT)-like permease